MQQGSELIVEWEESVCKPKFVVSQVHTLNQVYDRT